MKPQAAWVLGGTTVRLAQCLDLHSTNCQRPLPGAESSDEAKNLRLDPVFSTMACANKASRRAIVWQDALLALAFDRPAATQDMDFVEDLQQLPDTNSAKPLTYVEAMDWLCHFTLDSLPVQRCSVGQLLQTLENIDGLSMNHPVTGRHPGAPSCIRELHQTLAFRLHKGFVISTLCRPLVSSSGSRQLSEQDRSRTLERFQTALCQSAQAYIRLRSITGHARRSWAFIHNGLTSVLLLSLMEETRHLPETRKLQNEMIASLSDGDNSESSFSHDGPSNISESLKKVVKAIRTLQSLTKADGLHCHNSGPDKDHHTSFASATDPVNIQDSTTLEQNGYFPPFRVF